MTHRPWPRPLWRRVRASVDRIRAFQFENWTTAAPTCTIENLPLFGDASAKLYGQRAENSRIVVVDCVRKLRGPHRQIGGGNRGLPARARTLVRDHRRE